MIDRKENKRGWSGYKNIHTGTEWDEHGFDWQGNHKETGLHFCPKGYDCWGYDLLGFDQQGYNKNGFDTKGMHKETGTPYDPQGWDMARRHHITKELYDESGYNSDGFDRHGYDKEGYDVFNFNKYGYKRMENE